MGTELPSSFLASLPAAFRIQLVFETLDLPRAFAFAPFVRDSTRMCSLAQIASYLQWPLRTAERTFGATIQTVDGNSPLPPILGQVLSSGQPISQAAWGLREHLVTACHDCSATRQNPKRPRVCNPWSDGRRFIEFHPGRLFTDRHPSFWRCSKAGIEDNRGRAEATEVMGELRFSAYHNTSPPFLVSLH